MATFNTAESYGLPFGCVEAGAPADLVLLSDLRSWEVDHVVIDGDVDPIAGTGNPPASEIATDTVTFDPVEAIDLAIEHTGPGPVGVRVVDAVGGLQTARMEATVPVDTDDPERESVTSLALPVAGLMSDAPLADVKERFEAVEDVDDVAD